MHTVAKKRGLVGHERAPHFKGRSRSHHVEGVLARIFARQRGYFKKPLRISVRRMRGRTGAEVNTGVPMKFEDFQFGRFRVDGTVYDYDLIIDRGKIRKHKKNCRRSTASPLLGVCSRVSSVSWPTQLRIGLWVLHNARLAISPRPESHIPLRSRT